MSTARRLGPIAIVIAVCASGLSVAWSRPAGGEYGGLSKQGLPFKLTVADDRTTIAFDVRWACRNALRRARMFRRGGLALTDEGSFSWRGRNTFSEDDLDIRQRLRIDGRDNGDGTLTGIWRADEEAFDRVADRVTGTCTSGDVAFSVRRRDAPPGTDEAGNSIVALDGDPTRYGDVVLGPGGPWVLRTTSPASVLQIDPATAAPSAPIEIPDAELLAVGEGAAWAVSPVIGQQKDWSRLTRVDALTRATVAVEVGRSDDMGPSQAIAAGAGGVWLHHADRVLRADPANARVVRTISLRPVRGGRRCRVYGHPSNAITVSGGAVWVATGCREDLAPRYLQRIDPLSNHVTRTVRLRGDYEHIAIGPSDIWAATVGREVRDPNSPSGDAAIRQMSVHRIRMRDGRPVAARRMPRGFVTALAPDDRGVWLTQVTNNPRDGSLRRITKAGMRMHTPLKLEQPVSLAAGDGAVWVLDGFARTVTRVRPRGGNR